MLFEINGNPISLVPGLGIWEILTEDGTDFFTSPAYESFYERCKTAALRNIRDLSESQVCSAEMNQAPVPESTCEYVTGIGNLRKAVLVACDGSFCPETYTWGTGLAFFKSGQCLARRGKFKSWDTFLIGPKFNRLHVRPSSIELLALYSGLITSTQIGIAWRSKFSAARQDEWDSLASHLILVVDTMKSIQTLIDLGDDGYFQKKLYDPLQGALCTDIDECICHSIAAAISRAVAVFQRVTIMHRGKLPGFYNNGTTSWQGHHWLPDRLAHCARSSRNDMVFFPEEQERHAEFIIRTESRSRSSSDRSNELQSVTFSFPW